jgi:hypothetical protein
MCKAMEDMGEVAAKRTRVADNESLMRNLKLTAKQAMDALSVPQAQREMYAGLVGKRVSCRIPLYPATSLPETFRIWI